MRSGWFAARRRGDADRRAGYCDAADGEQHDAAAGGRIEMPTIAVESDRAGIQPGVKRVAFLAPVSTARHQCQQYM